MQVTFRLSGLPELIIELPRFLFASLGDAEILGQVLSTRLECCVDLLVDEPFCLSREEVEDEPADHKVEPPRSVLHIETRALDQRELAQGSVESLFDSAQHARSDFDTR